MGNPMNSTEKHRFRLMDPTKASCVFGGFDFGPRRSKQNAAGGAITIGGPPKVDGSPGKKPHKRTSCTKFKLHRLDLHDLLVQELAVQSAAQEAQPSSSPSALPSGPSAVPPMLGCELCMLRFCVCC